MSLFERRFSCRKFKAEGVTDGVVSSILSAAIMSPSAGNIQPWRFVVVYNDDVKKKLVSASFGHKFIASAPVVIVVCAVPEESGKKYGERGRSLYCIQDTAAATENILLAATLAGLGACWVGAFNEKDVSSAIGVDSSMRPVSIIPIGVPDEGSRQKSRRGLDGLTMVIK